MKAAALLREKYGNPPSDPAARVAHDGLLEVLDPARRTVRLQKEMSAATRKAAMTAQAERRARERRATDRRRSNQGPPGGGPDRRKGDRRSKERRSRG